MNAIPDQGGFAVDAPFAPARREWGVAFRALRKLLADKDDTVQVFEIMRALNGPATRDGYLRLLGSASGGRIAYHRRELAEVLTDRVALAAMPADSLAAKYLVFTEAHQISADGLVDISRTVGRGRIELAHPVAWYGRRIRDMHDLWHIVTGYDLSGLGEAALVAFSFAQTRGYGWAAIAVGAAITGARQPGAPYARAIVEGYRRGKTAAWLPGQDWEALLAEPLDAVRAKMGLKPPSIFNSIPVAVRSHGLPKAA